MFLRDSVFEFMLCLEDLVRHLTGHIVYIVTTRRISNITREIGIEKNLLLTRTEIIWQSIYPHEVKLVALKKHVYQPGC